MARPLRLELAGGLYHVTSRGNGRQDIYLDDEDRQIWLDLLAETCAGFNWVCHAYCLMTNHYHIVLETVEGNLSQGMRQLNGVYTQRFNRQHRREWVMCFKVAIRPFWSTKTVICSNFRAMWC